eukprot:PhF_6_TR31178/c0_g1_i1/m.45711
MKMPPFQKYHLLILFRILPSFFLASTLQDCPSLESKKEGVPKGPTPSPSVQLALHHRRPHSRNSDVRARSPPTTELRVGASTPDVPRVHTPGQLQYVFTHLRSGVASVSAQLTHQNEDHRSRVVVEALDVQRKCLRRVHELNHTTLQMLKPL